MNYYMLLAIILFFYLNFWFILSIKHKRNDLADVAWGLGFVLLSWISLVIAEAFTFQNFLLSTLVTIWGLRLSWYINSRNRSKPEDFRYKEWRTGWGK